MGRKVSLRFSRITPNNTLANTRQIQNFRGTILNKKCKVGDRVFVRDFSKPNKKGWKACLVDEIMGNSMYICKDESSNMFYKRHVDQIIKGGSFYKENGLEKILSETLIGESTPVTQNITTETLKDCSGTHSIHDNVHRSTRTTRIPSKFKDFV